MRRAPRQLLAQVAQWPQAARADPPGEQQHAGQRQREGQHQRAHEGLHQLVAHIQPVGGGHAHALVLQHIGAPLLAALGDLAKARAAGRGHVRDVVGARDGQDVHFAAHQAHLAGHAIAANDRQQRIVAGARRCRQLGLLELLHDAHHHPGRCDEAVVQQRAQLALHVGELPDRHAAPDQANGQAQAQHQPNPQALHRSCRHAAPPQ